MDYFQNDTYVAYVKRNRRKTVFRGFARIMACIVAFVTTYALILPAITMEKVSFCGLEEHAHTEACYSLQIQNQILICDGGNLGIHVHDASCRNGDGVVVCGQADYVVHSHGDSCRDSDGVLVCTLEERSQHMHSDACYYTAEPIAHVHSDDCKVPVKGDLICGLEIKEGHKHSDDCYQVGSELVCAKTAGHQHSDSCYVNPLVCKQSTQPHSHGAECYGKELACTISEEHDHEDTCYQESLICGKAEGAVHVHEGTCYSGDRILECKLDENHVHEDSCYKKNLICETPESEGHSHEDGCYHWDTEYGCGMEEGEPEEVKPVLVCTEPTAPVHIHGEGCFETTTVDADPICGNDHDHHYSCYVCSCTLQEHTHALQCYSDPEADVESRETWEATMNNVELTGDWHEDVVAIAESQLGYVESTRNYAVWEDNSMHGYTRYGAWYGVPYGDWCGMFTSFCLHYAGVEGMPYHYGVRPWIEKLSEPELDLYRVAEEYTPIPGDLVFFDWEDDGLSDHVGIVYEVIAATETEKAKLKTIEGNSSNCVRFVTYDLEDPVLLGYSMLPEKPEEEVPVYYCGLEEHTHGEECYDEEENLTCEQAEHQHEESCLTEQNEEVEYFCGLEEHTHGEECYDEAENLICEQAEHQHEESCLREQTEEVKYFCGLEEHTHGDGCYDEEENLICEQAEHQHEESCLMEQTEEVEYFCGLEEHTHGDGCYDEEENLICEQAEHTHTSLCMTDLSDLDVASREKVEEVIRLIDEIPSADEIDAKILEFEEAEDYEGEELWLTEVYQNVGLAYSYYVGLTEELQARVINREKLLELEYIWSMMPLATYYVWLDGTNGGMMSLAGAADTRYTLNTSGQRPYSFTLPTTWESPARYNYTLRGWYDINAKQYYAPGETVSINQNTVFYADWRASTYDIGQFNSHVVDTVSTNEFITTRMFDYSAVFNLYSSQHTGNISANDHDETWNIVSKGGQIPNGGTSLGVILRDWDDGGSRQLSYPKNYSQSAHRHNNSQDTITTGLLYEYDMYNLFFNPNNSFDPTTKQGIMGKEYLGTADHLFQYDSDPNSDTYGYYYFDSERNAASYNQSAGRFYVYDYLERTSDSSNSDFLPLNSPYANINQMAPDYASNRYTYDAKDNSGIAGTNFWFGMTTDIRFYLPNAPGTQTDSGYGNQSMYGDDMVFAFSGDDDVWVLVDNQLILDIGGMHGARSGSIDFSTGTVIVEGEEQTDKSEIVKRLGTGEHTLTLLYMERGSSLSNCSIYFNISPRFTMALQKEDLLTNEKLSGAEFQVFLDENCEEPATLWPSYEAYRQNVEGTTNKLTVSDGEASIWGFAAGHTYYIKETVPPSDGNYILPNGLIRVELSNKGIASYSAVVIPDSNAPEGEENPSPGFTVEGFRIDEKKHVAYLIVNNSLHESETTEVLVKKVWEGTQTRPITVYLLADGIRIREMILSDENDWRHIWDNLPMYKTVVDPETGESEETEIVYTVEEGTVPGYVGRVEIMTEDASASVSWEQADNFQVRETYLLQSSQGYLATNANGGLSWVNEATAKASDSAQWNIVSIDGDVVCLQNSAGYYLRYHNGGWRESDCYFYASTQQGTITFTESRFREVDGGRYMLHRIDSSGHAPGKWNSRDSEVAVYTLHKKILEENSETIEGLGFRIINTPIPDENQMSLTVTKRWTQRDGETAIADASLYETLSIPVKLQADGQDTGQSGVLNLKSSWKHTFSNLPRKDAQGTDIVYTVAEDWESEYWQPRYGPVTETQDGFYTVEINNVYSYLAEIPVEKQWDATIRDSEKTPVEIHLYSAADDETQGTLQETITVSAETQWKGVFRVIPPEEAGVNYYIYESTGQFIPDYGNQTRLFIDGNSRKVGKVVFDAETGTVEAAIVTNRPVVELPKTGASGTGGFTAGGLLLATAAWILLCIKRRKGTMDTS